MSFRVRRDSLVSFRCVIGTPGAAQCAFFFLPWSRKHRGGGLGGGVRSVLLARRGFFGSGQTQGLNSMSDRNVGAAGTWLIRLTQRGSGQLVAGPDSSYN